MFEEHTQKRFTLLPLYSWKLPNQLQAQSATVLLLLSVVKSTEKWVQSKKWKSGKMKVWMIMEVRRIFLCLCKFYLMFDYTGSQERRSEGESERNNIAHHNRWQLWWREGKTRQKLPPKSIFDRFNWTDSVMHNHTTNLPAMVSTNTEPPKESLVFSAVIHW